MDPLTITTLLNLVKRYWWVLLIVGCLVYIQILHSSISSRDKTIETQKQTITLKDKEIVDFKEKIATQNATVDLMAQKGKEQIKALDDAIRKVNVLKPATQVTIREIYTDKSKDIDALLFNAKLD